MDAARAGTPDTLSILGNQRFFDDFAYDGPLPDSNRWFISSSNLDAPYVNRNRAIDPPTWGVASFDGTNRFNEPYNISSLSVGLCDRLVSHYIDLSTFQASDNLKLSFALQAKGKGEAPEGVDSFQVYFYLAESGQQELVFSRGGQDGGSFSQVIIPIDQPEYFTTQFQIIFESIGSQNGKLDEWHLDYVLLDEGRANNDTLFDDIAPTEIIRPPLSPYTAIPYSVLDPSQNWMSPTSIRFNNLSVNNKLPVVTEKITDPVGNNSFVGLFEQDEVLQLPSLSTRDLNFNRFSDQYFQQAGLIQLAVSFPNSNDQVSSNNTMTVNYRVDSLLAYDDGEADRGIGLGKPWGLANQFFLEEEDSIVAIWINFLPAINFNPITTQTTYLEEQAFRLTIWKDPHPDSIAAQQIAGAKIAYGDAPDHFERYTLSSPVAVQDTFWVGIVQTNSIPLNIGFDTQFSGEGLVWQDSAGVWAQVQEQGVLMIRPELASRNNFGPATVEPVYKNTHYRIWQNPVLGYQVQVYNEGPTLPDYTGQLLTLQGQSLLQIKQPLLPGTNVISIPGNLPAGIYLWQHQDHSQRSFEKIWIQ